MHRLHQERKALIEAERTAEDWFGIQCLEMLNGEHSDVSKQSCRRAKQLLLDLQELERIRVTLRPMTRHESRFRDHIWPNVEFDERWAAQLSRSGRDLIWSINRRLEKYILHPRLSVQFDQPALGSESSNWKTTSQYYENLAVRAFLRKLSIGRIDWYRQCADCKRWFLASTEHQKFCAVKCRIRHHAHSDEFRRKRAEYMRLRYRPGQRERDQTSLQIAKRIKRSGDKREAGN